MSLETFNYSEKPRFQRWMVIMVFCKDLGFGGSFGYLTNTI